MTSPPLVAPSAASPAARVLPSAGTREVLHPATQLVLLLCGLALVYGISSPASSACVLLVAGVCAVISRRIAFTHWLAAMAALAGPTLVMIAIIQGLFYPGDALTVLWRAGPAAVTVEGLSVGAQLWLRIAAMIGVCALFGMGSDSARMFDGLIKLRLPTAIAYICASAMSLIPLFRQQTSAALRAHAARGWNTSRPLTRIRLLPRILAGLLTSALVQLDQRYETLSQRGFSTRRRSAPLQDHRDGAFQRALRWAAPCATVALVAASLAGLLPLPSAGAIVGIVAMR